MSPPGPATTLEGHNRPYNRVMPQSPRETVEALVKEAMKARDTARLQTLRLLLAEVKNRAIELGRELDEGELHRLVQRGIKQRQESARQYEEGGREELAEKERGEAAILEELLPAQADEGEIRAAIADFVAASGVEGPAAMGAVMKAMMERFAGKADGATVNRLAREILG